MRPYNGRPRPDAPRGREPPSFDVLRRLAAFCRSPPIPYRSRPLSDGPSRPPPRPLGRYRREPPWVCERRCITCYSENRGARSQPCQGRTARRSIGAQGGRPYSKPAVWYTDASLATPGRRPPLTRPGGGRSWSVPRALAVQSDRNAPQNEPQNRATRCGNVAVQTATRCGTNAKRQVEALSGTEKRA